jgi:hypothetical protein
MAQIKEITLLPAAESNAVPVIKKCYMLLTILGRTAVMRK